MKIRCDLNVNGGSRKLLLVPGIQETAEHLGMKLAAYLLHWDLNPIVEASSRHPALASQEFIPDVMALDASGAIQLWVECGKVTLHKLNKLSRRLPDAQILVLKASEAEARRLRDDLDSEIDRGDRIRILAWPPSQFKAWMGALQEKTEIFGDTSRHMLNIVVNAHPLVAEFLAI